MVKKMIVEGEAEYKIDPIKTLEEHIDQCISLSFPPEKYDNAMQIIKRISNEIIRIDFKDDTQIIRKFGNFANRCLSTIESMGSLSPVQYKGIRKLILDEIYLARDYILRSQGYEPSNYSRQ